MSISDYKALSGATPSRDVDSISADDWDIVDQYHKEILDDPEVMDYLQNVIIQIKGNRSDLTDMIRDLAVNEYLLSLDERDAKYELSVDLYDYYL